MHAFVKRQYRSLGTLLKEAEDTVAANRLKNCYQRGLCLSPLNDKGNWLSACLGDRGKQSGENGVQTGGAF